MLGRYALFVAATVALSAAIVTAAAWAVLAWDDPSADGGKMAGLIGLVVVPMAAAVAVIGGGAGFFPFRAAFRALRRRGYGPKGAAALASPASVVCGLAACWLAERIVFGEMGGIIDLSGVFAFAAALGTVPALVVGPGIAAVLWRGDGQVERT